MTTTDHAIVAPAVTGDPGTRADAGGFDPGRPFRTRDGREVKGFGRAFGGGYFGKVKLVPHCRWRPDGTCVYRDEDLDLVNVDPAAPDPIRQPEGDAPPAPAQSAGAAADGEDDAAFVERMRADPSQVNESENWDRLVALAARPHEPADASARSARGEMAERDVAELQAWRDNVRVMLASDRDVVRCHEGGGPEDMIGSLCLTMLRTRNARDKAQVALEATPAAVLDRARPAGQSEGEPAAWQWRNSREDFWHFAAKEDRAVWEASLYKFGEYRALYAAPPSAAAAPPAPAPPAPASRATSAPAQDAGPAGVTEAEVEAAYQSWLNERHGLDHREAWQRILEAAARARTPDAGKETGR